MATELNTRTAKMNCPYCQGPMWDNREQKGETGKEKMPDFRCKDETCINKKSGKVTAIWLNPGEQMCPQCGGFMWDNREKKQKGIYKSTAPDFKCRNTACMHVVWPDKGEKKGTQNREQYEVQRAKEEKQELEDQGFDDAMADDIPF